MSNEKKEMAMEFGDTSREVLPAPEMLTVFSMPGLEVFQITTRTDCHAHGFYDPDQAFDPTGRYMLLNREHADPARRMLLLCDFNDDFSLTVLSDGPQYTDAAFSRDGQSIYYSVPAPGVITVRRVSAPDLKSETVCELEGPLPDTGIRLNATEDILRVGGGVRLSHDGRHLLVSFFTDQHPCRSVALAIFDTQSWQLLNNFELGPRYWNSKTRYAPCFGPDGEYLIAVGDCFSESGFNEDGAWFCNPLDDVGGALYLIDESGTVKMAYPVGRDRPRQNTSHWDFFGRTLAAVFHTDTFDTAPHYRGCIMYAEPLPCNPETQHLGRHMPGGRQIDMTRHVVRPDVCHLRTDGDGTHMVCDTIGYHDGMESYVYTGTINHDEEGPYLVPAFLVHPKSSWKPYWCECIPAFSPDRQWVVFNSDYPGVQGYGGERHVPQVFAARGYTFPGHVTE
ncbi:MAG: hypothetical protein QGF00_18390 [Planctomycetota bacterium]|nr:hypothetical protein [Planctomycetota bacterium]